MTRLRVLKRPEKKSDENNGSPTKSSGRRPAKGSSRTPLQPRLEPGDVFCKPPRRAHRRMQSWTWCMCFVRRPHARLDAHRELAPCRRSQSERDSNCSCRCTGGGVPCTMPHCRVGALRSGPLKGWLRLEAWHSVQRDRFRKARCRWCVALPAHAASRRVGGREPPPLFAWTGRAARSPGAHAGPAQGSRGNCLSCC